MNKLQPNLTVNATSNKIINLSELKGQNLILYFYPKDCTSGCTREGQDFRDRYDEFLQLNTTIFGVSRDSINYMKNLSNNNNFLLN